MEEEKNEGAHSSESSNESADRSDNANKEEGKNSLLEEQPAIVDEDKSASNLSVKSSENESANEKVRNFSNLFIAWRE